MFSPEVTYFLEAVKAGGITRAAEQLGLSQPAVSKAIARLEARLGTALFVRTARGTDLTEAGKAFHTQMCEALRAVEDAMAQARDIGGGHAGQIRVGMTPATSTFVLQALLPRLKQDRPAAVLQFHEAFADELFDALSRHELHLAVAPLPVEAPAGLHCEVLYEEGYYVVHNEHHPLARKPHLTLHDLQDCASAASSTKESARQSAEKTLRDAGVRMPPIAVEANTLAAILHAVSTCELVTILPDSIPASRLPGNLQLRRLAMTLPRRRIGLYTSPGYTSSISARAIHLLQEGAALMQR